MYNKVAKDLNFPAREKEIAQLWKDKDIVRRSFHFRDGAKRLTFFDGPPTANGRPHIGHIENARHQRPDSALLDDEGVQRLAQSRLGYPRSAR